jgi:TrmH family RNA methyltransferase
LIHSRSNPLVKQARALRERKAREETGLFLVEGIHHLGEAVAAGWEIDAILYAPDGLKSEFALGLLSGFPGRQEQVSSEIMDYVCAKENPAGIVAIVHQRSPELHELVGLGRCVAVVAPQDPGNVGTILRTMDAAGCEALFILDGGVDSYHPTVIRAAMGASFWTPIVRASFNSFCAWSREHNFQLIGTSAHAHQDYLEFKPTEPWILLLGSEQKGLTAAQMEACEAVVSLPMRGRASSEHMILPAEPFVGPRGMLPARGRRRPE